MKPTVVVPPLLDDPPDGEDPAVVDLAQAFSASAVSATAAAHDARRRLLVNGYPLLCGGSSGMWNSRRQATEFVRARLSASGAWVLPSLATETRATSVTR